jgi:hypothetical protein
MSNEYNNYINEFSKMIDRTSYIKCNDKFHSELAKAIGLETNLPNSINPKPQMQNYSNEYYKQIEVAIQKWNNCSRNEHFKSNE